MTGFEMRAIAQDHDPVEGQARFRAVPVNELIDGVTITALCVCCRLFNTAALACSRSGKRRIDLLLLRLLLELCFMTVASVPPINDQSSVATVR